MSMSLSARHCATCGLMVLLVGLLVGPPVQAQDNGAVEDGLPGVPTQGEQLAERPWRGRSAFEVWNEEHRWVRIGLSFFASDLSEQDHANLRMGPGVSLSVTTDFFMGLGIKLGFVGGYHKGKVPTHGIDFTWREPLVSDPDTGMTVIDGSKGTATPGSAFMEPQRRTAHVAYYGLTIGGNYELNLPNVDFFRVVQPFFGGGVALLWVYTYSDITADEFVLINNYENDPFDQDNIDPWSKQGPEVGGEIYGGVNINATQLFRFKLEVGYLNVAVPSADLSKATEGFDAKHLDYALALFRFGGGFEFRF